MKIKVDYKGKHFVLQDKLSLDGLDYPVGEMSDDEITDKFLEQHVSACSYYGIPAYIGDDKSLKERIKKLNNHA